MMKGSWFLSTSLSLLLASLFLEMMTHILLPTVHLDMSIVCFHIYAFKQII